MQAGTKTAIEKIEFISSLLFKCLDVRFVLKSCENEASTRRQYVGSKDGRKLPENLRILEC